MKRASKIALASATVVAAAALPVFAWHGQAPLPDSADQVAARIAEIRVRGPDGFAALWRANRDLIDKVRAGGAGSLGPDDARAWRALQPILDGAAQQRDVYMSGLYWYTDLTEAETAARATGRPILSLRMLGRLVDEKSCANSRFFRTLLYSDGEIAGYLGRHFILHWSSERPVPRITIDLGDGRAIESTITGNSIHYVLDAQGQPIDALPGLYSPARFRAGLERAVALHDRLARISPRARAASLAAYHEERARILARELVAMVPDAGRSPDERIDDSIDWQLVGTIRTIDGTQSGGTVMQLDEGRMGKPAVASARGKVGVPPSARNAVPRAAAKASFERRVVPTPAPYDPILAADETARQLGDAGWARVAARLLGEVVIAPGARELIRQKSLASQPALAGADTSIDAILLRRLAGLRVLVAQDTARNEYDFHRRIHAWFQQGQVSSFAQLNERVYSELFLTPRSDPWLGLVTADTYAGLDGDGIVSQPRDGAAAD